MSRIYDALKKAEGERQTQPAGPEAAAAAPAQPAPPVEAVTTVAGDWGRIPADLTRELSAVRRLVESKLPEHARIALGIASSVDGEGATTVMLGFARTLATDARIRVLLVDAEGRRQDVSRRWAPGAPGWSDLTSAEQVSSALVRTQVPNVDVLPYGTRPDMSPAQAAELLVEAVRRVAQGYQYVVFDCGSVLGTPTARYLAGALDGILMVVHASGTRREICQKALEELQKTQAPVLGVVLNRRQYLIPEAIYKRI